MEKAHSKSLWNYTLSPGWNDKEVQVLKNALQYFGIGRWKKIQLLNCLPNKTISQIYMQTQRLLGQQSLGDFMGLKIHLDQVWRYNSEKVNVIRKFNCVINSGDNPTKEERKIRIKDNEKKYGLTLEEQQAIKKPYGYKDIRQIMSVEEIEQNKHKLSTLDVIQELDFTRQEIKKRIKVCEKMSSSQDNSLINSDIEIDDDEENDNLNKKMKGNDGFCNESSENNNTSSEKEELDDFKIGKKSTIQTNDLQQTEQQSNISKPLFQLDKSQSTLQMFFFTKKKKTKINEDLQQDKENNDQSTQQQQQQIKCQQ